MEQKEITHQPCPDCGSSDALAIYPTNTYCFSCYKWKPINSTDDEMEEPIMPSTQPTRPLQSYDTLGYEAIVDRKIELETCKK